MQMAINDELDSIIQIQSQVAVETSDQMPSGVPFILRLLYCEEFRHSSVDLFIIKLLRHLAHEVFVPVLICGMRSFFTRLDSPVDEILSTLNSINVDTNKEVKQLLHLMHHITAWFHRPVGVGSC